LSYCGRRWNDGEVSQGDWRRPDSASCSYRRVHPKAECNSSAYRVFRPPPSNCSNGQVLRIFLPPPRRCCSSRQALRSKTDHPPTEISPRQRERSRSASGRSFVKCDSRVLSSRLSDWRGPAEARLLLGSRSTAERDGRLFGPPREQPDPTEGSATGREQGGAVCASVYTRWVGKEARGSRSA
jgi:hypothetical protein